MTNIIKYKLFSRAYLIKIFNALKNDKKKDDNIHKKNFTNQIIKRTRLAYVNIQGTKTWYFLTV